MRLGYRRGDRLTILVVRTGWTEWRRAFEPFSHNGLGLLLIEGNMGKAFPQGF